MLKRWFLIVVSESLINSCMMLSQYFSKKVNIVMTTFIYGRPDSTIRKSIRSSWLYHQEVHTVVLTLPSGSPYSRLNSTISIKEIFIRDFFMKGMYILIVCTDTLMLISSITKTVNCILNILLWTIKGESLSLFLILEIDFVNHLELGGAFLMWLPGWLTIFARGYSSQQ